MAPKVPSLITDLFLFSRRYFNSANCSLFFAGYIRERDVEGQVWQVERRKRWSAWSGREERGRTPGRARESRTYRARVPSRRGRTAWHRDAWTYASQASAQSAGQFHFRLPLLFLTFTFSVSIDIDFQDSLPKRSSWLDSKLLNCWVCYLGLCFVRSEHDFFFRFAGRAPERFGIAPWTGSGWTW